MGGARALTRGKGQASGVKREATVSERLGPRAADRVLEILDLLARRRRGLSLGDISRLLDIPKASLSDLLKPLVARSYIDRDENGHFSIGPATTALARAIVFSGELVDLARPFLEQLVRVTGETVLIASLDEASMVTVYIDKVEPDSPIRYTVPIGLRRELHATSVGKVFLAHLPARRVEQFFARQNLERNEGTFRSVTITAPKGTVVHAEAPAPCTFCTSNPAHQIVQACWKALGKAAPQRSCAGWGKKLFPVTSGLGVDGRTFVLYHWGANSGGGRCRRSRWV